MNKNALVLFIRKYFVRNVTKSRRFRSKFDNVNVAVRPNRMRYFI